MFAQQNKQNTFKYLYNPIQYFLYTELSRNPLLYLYPQLQIYSPDEYMAFVQFYNDIDLMNHVKSHTILLFLQ